MAIIGFERVENIIVHGNLFIDTKDGTQILADKKVLAILYTKNFDIKSKENPVEYLDFRHYSPADNPK